MTPKELILENLEWAKRLAKGNPVYGMAQDDFEQEVVHALTKAANTYDSKRNDQFQGYAQRVIRNHLINLGSKVGYRAERQSDLDERLSFDAEMTADKILPPDRETHRNEVREKLAESLSALTEKQQYVLIAQAQGKTNPEIADELDCSKNNVQQISAAALKALRPQIENRGVYGVRFMPAADRHIPTAPTTLPTPVTKKEPEPTSRLVVLLLWVVLVIGVMIAIALQISR